MTTAQFRMAEKTNPKAFGGEFSIIEPPVDNHDTAIQQRLQQDKAHATSVVPPSAAQYVPSSAPLSASDGGATMRQCVGVRLPKELPATASTNTRASIHEQDRVIKGGGQLPEDVRELNDHLSDRVRKRSPDPAEAQTTAGHTSQARDTSDKLPLISSHNEVKKGPADGEDVEHDGPRKPKKRGDLPKTKRAKVEAN